MNSYGVGGVESRHAIDGRSLKSDLKGDSSPHGPRHLKAAMAHGNVENGDIEWKPLSRISALPDPSLYDTYAREQSPWQTIDPPMPEEVAEAAEFKYPGITGSPRAA